MISYDEPEILPSQNDLFCPTRADAGQLADLQKLGFNDEAFWRVHHYRLKSEKERIASFRAYCEKKHSFQSGGTNERVGQRLAYVLNHYRARGLAPGQTQAMIDLAEAAFRALP